MGKKKQQQPKKPQQKGEAKAQQRPDSPRSTAPQKASKKKEPQPTLFYNGKPIDEISLFRNPITVTSTMIILIFRFLFGLPGLLLRYWYISIVVPSLIGLAVVLPGPHQEHLPLAKDILLFAGYWVVLGIASSIGLGTGLHTFILYLGPHIAKVTLAANACGYVPRHLPSKWRLEHFEPCPNPLGPESLSILEIIKTILPEGFLWGVGTAIGELPPYFVARSASLAGGMDEELQEMTEGLDAAKESELPFIERMKRKLFVGMRRNAFVFVLLCASIPNPLFDLAGLTCGHLLIPFWTFFSATCIGKACVKASMQSMSMVLMFSASHVEHFIAFVEGLLPFLKGSMTAALEKQKSKLYQARTGDEEVPLIQWLWNWVVYLMIMYFAYSFINSIVRNELKSKAEEQQAQTGKKKKKNN